MRAPAFVPTITQRVRLFLTEQGAAIRPWAGLQETYDELYALLQRRRADPAFWLPLKGLLGEVLNSAADSQRRQRRTRSAAELLATWQVDELVDELRDALPDDTTVASLSRTDFTRTLSTAVLGGFLLLGLAAAGCGGDSSLSTPPGTGGAGGQTVLLGGTGDAQGAGGAAADSGGSDASGRACTQTVDQALDHAIGESTLAADGKSQLCQCFSALSSSWTTSLTQLFATATPEEISKMLSGLIPCCTSDGIVTVGGSGGHPSAADLSQIQSGSGYRLCTAVIYKGVSFAD